MADIYLIIIFMLVDELRPPLFLIMVTYEPHLTAKVVPVLLIEALITIHIVHSVAFFSDVNTVDIGTQRFNHSLILTQEVGSKLTLSVGIVDI